MAACCSRCATNEEVVHDHNHDHEHGHDHQHGAESTKVLLVRLLLAIALLIIVNIVEISNNIMIMTYVLAYVLAGYEVVWQAVKGVCRRDMLNENFLMTLASTGAFVLGDMNEAVSVMVFFGIGELLQNMAVQRSRGDIAKLMDIRPDYANLKRGDNVVVVSPTEVAVDDYIVVKPGERVPLDGVVATGTSSLDTVAITGESVPTVVRPGQVVYSGSVNGSGVLEIKVTKLFAESTVSKILQMVEHARSKKSHSEKFITKFATYYTPFVVLVAVLVAVLPPLLNYGTYSTWIYRALTFLIVSCPCALVVAIPLSFFAGIGGAARHGILIKGANYLEALHTIDTVVFDKTGTLTKGVFEVVDVITLAEYSSEEVLALAASAELNSNHPIAKAIVSANGLPTEKIMDIVEVAGMGVRANTSYGDVCIGNLQLMSDYGIKDLPVFDNTAVYVACDGKLQGVILVADVLKTDVREALQTLIACGIKKVSMFTGDNERVAARVASSLGIEYSAGMLPQDKVANLEIMMQEKSTKGKTMFVGDGINDAPVISRADIGVAMGAMGSDAAIEAADIVIMNDDIGNIAKALKIGRKTRSIVMQNIVMALGIKALVMVGAFLGFASMWAAIFADVGVALLAVINAVRALRG